MRSKTRSISLVLGISILLATMFAATAQAAPTYRGGCLHSIGGGSVEISITTLNAGAAEARIVVGSNYGRWTRLGAYGTQKWRGTLWNTPSSNARVDYHIGNSNGWTSGTIGYVNSRNDSTPCG